MRLPQPLIVATLLFALQPGLFAQELPRAAVVPDSSNYRRLLEFIRPSKTELSYEAIGWRSAFWPAVEEARKLGRPILLWTMNGHPLGCT